MGWPTPQEYNEAIQNPRSAFEDPELRGGEPLLTPLGLPRPITGAFASVYQMACAGGRTYAVRCFLREFGDQQERYAAISAHLGRVNLPYMVDFTYLANGIRVGGRWYPILKMEWLEGVSLQAFIESNLHNPAALLTLAEQWVQMASDLRLVEIGHGDLQHGNVIVVDGSLRLIDYDGMYVPSLAGRRSHEIGHRNYQHPQRSEREFGPEVDHFSTWVVYTSLAALSVHPEWWQRYGGGDEALLFRREDFERPAQSRIFRDLEASHDVRLRSLGSIFAAWTLAPPTQVPSISGAPGGAQGRALSGASGGVFWHVGSGAPPQAPNGSGAPGGRRHAPAGAPPDWLRDHVAAPAPVALTPAAPPQAVPLDQAPPTSAIGWPPVGGATLPPAQTHAAAPETGEQLRDSDVFTSTPSWIRDFLGEQQMTPAEFAGDGMGGRVALWSAMTLTLLAWFAAFVFSIPATATLAATTVAALGALGVLANGYRSDASVLAQRAEWQRLHAVNVASRRVRRKLKAAQRRQRRAQREHEHRRERLAARVKGSQEAEAADLQRHDQKLQQALAAARRRRDLAAAAGADEVRKLEARHAAYVASVNQQIAGLHQLEEAELQQTLARRKEQFVTGYMKRQTIDAAVIAGIGPTAKEALRKHGIVRAQDLDAPRLAQIPGIGEAKARVLLDWRRRAESLALQTAPQGLSKIEETIIRGRYYQRRFVLEQDKVKAQRKLSKDVTASQASTAAQLKTLDQEPVTLQAAAVHKRAGLKQRYAEQRAQAEARLQAYDGEAAGRHAPLVADEAAVRQELVLLNAQRVSIELRLRRYENLGFVAYVRRATSLR
jgi:hypothetical protein